MIKGSKKLPESAVADWHGDEEPRYLKVLKAIASQQVLKKRLGRSVWATAGCGAAIAAPTQEIRLAVGALLALITIVFAFAFLRRVIKVKELQEEADQTIRILPEEEDPQEQAA